MDRGVDIIVPCYNMELYLGGFIEKIIEQTYDYIRIVFVDDGSKDRTKEIIQKGRKAIEKRGFAYKYVYKENGGLPSAIKCGLDFLERKYFTWVDPDDFLSKESIENKVEFLEKNSNYGLVRTNAYVYLEKDLKNPINRIISSEKEEIFEDLILENKMPLTAGNYLVSTEKFLEVNPNKRIFCEARGQNWQMLLPIAYKYRCGYINKYLNNYVVIEGSMSHSDKTFDDEISRANEHKEILIQTIKLIHENNEEFNYEYYKELIKEKYIRKEMNISFKYNEKKYLEKAFRELKNKNSMDRIKYSISSNMLVRKIYQIVKKMSVM